MNTVTVRAVMVGVLIAVWAWAADVARLHAGPIARTPRVAGVAPDAAAADGDVAGVVVDPVAGDVEAVRRGRLGSGRSQRDSPTAPNSATVWRS